MQIAIYPGTFDPITLGHIDIVKRAAKIFDSVIVVIAVNSDKKTLFSKQERLSMATDAVRHIPNVNVIVSDKLTVDIAREHNANTIIRGIRAVSDYEYEFQLALTNRKISNNAIDTFFMLPNEKYTYLTSSVVRELAKYGETLECFVNENVALQLKQKFNQNLPQTTI
jgi:pantetheine-phosphate adenylyltransferase